MDSKRYIDPRATSEEINAHFRKWAEQGPTIVTSRTICPRCKTSFEGLFAYMPKHECIKPLPHTQDSDCVLDEQSQCVMCGVDHSGPPCEQCQGKGFHNPICPQLESLRAANRVLGRAVLELNRPPDDLLPQPAAPSMTLNCPHCGRFIDLTKEEK